ncbi:hypothetical protein BH09PSE2_BH09PSE2_07080 [soil metagenome]
MRNYKLIACVAGAAMLLCGPSLAATRKAAAKAPAADYATDVITVVSNTRQAIPPTANCVVWANAEGLGVGPAELNGFHGVGFNINPKPLAAETNQRPTTFAEGLADMKTQFPTTPAWMTAAIVKNQAKIEAACESEQTTPYLIQKLTKADKK